MAAFITPVEVTPGTAGAWTDVDVSANIPAGSTGVIVHIVNTDTGGLALGLRKNGSTDGRTNNMRADSHKWACIGVDGSRIFEAFVGSTTLIDIFLVGYFTTDAVFFTNAVDKSIGATGAWTDVDISGDTGADTAIAAVWELVDTTNSGLSWGFRKNGSTDNRLQFSNAGSQHVFGIIGVDGSEIFEHQTASLSIDVFLVGYLKSGAVLNTNALDRSLGSTGSFVDLTALPAGAIGGIYEVINTSAAADWGLRKNGSSESILHTQRHGWSIPEADASQLVEGQIAATTQDFFEIGHFTSAAQQFSQSVAGTLTSAGALTKRAGKSLAGALASSGALARRIGKGLAAVLDESGNVVKQASGSLAGALTPAGALARRIGKSLAAAASFSGDLTTTKVIMKLLEAALASSGTAAKQAGKGLAALFDQAGNVVRDSSAALAGALGFTGSVTAIASRLVLLTSTLTLSGDAAKSVGKGLAALLDQAGNAVREAGKSLAGALGFTGDLAASVVHMVFLAASLALSGALARSAVKGLAGALALSGAALKAVAKLVEGFLNFVGSLLAVELGRRDVTLRMTPHEYDVTLEIRDP